MNDFDFLGAPRRGNMMMYVIIGIVVLVLILVAGVSIYGYSQLGWFGADYPEKSRTFGSSCKQTADCSEGLSCLGHPDDENQTICRLAQATCPDQVELNETTCADYCPAPVDLNAETCASFCPACPSADATADPTANTTPAV